ARRADRQIDKQVLHRPFLRNINRWLEPSRSRGIDRGQAHRPALACPSERSTAARAAAPAPPLLYFFCPSGPNCARKAHRSVTSCSFLIPAKIILVPGIRPRGLAMYSRKLASFQTIFAFLLASV